MIKCIVTSLFCVVTICVTESFCEFTLHPIGGSSNSDWCVNSFIMVVCEKKNYSHPLEHQNLTELKIKFRIDHHYKTIYEPVRIERSSYRV